MALPLSARAAKANHYYGVLLSCPGPGYRGELWHRACRPLPEVSDLGMVRPRASL